MPFQLVKMPKFVTWLYPKRIWAFSDSQNKVYLTFDDGPIPEVTPWVLKTLREYRAKATFFCIGENIQKHPELFQKLLSEGHSIGNHTFHHLKGTKTSLKGYLEDVALGQDQIAKHTTQNPKKPKLFRPPYGRMTHSQAKSLLGEEYQIIMWTVLSYDWDLKVSPEQCLQNVIKNLQPGSIVVFHDSLKAKNNLEFALPKVLAYIREKGWECATL